MKLVEMMPVGISMGPAVGRPVLIFKDKTENHILPVWLDVVDAGLMLAESQTKTRASGVHHAVLKIFNAFELKAQNVIFDEIIGHHQYVTVRLRQKKAKPVQVKLRAAEVMSLCLKAGATFYALPDVIEKSREIDLSLAAVQQGALGSGAFGGLESVPEILKN